MSKRLVGVFAGVALLGTPALGQEPLNIEVLLKYGIYDETYVASERYTFDQVRSILRESKAETIESFEKEAANLGIDVPALAKLEFGGKSAKANFRDWKYAFLNATSSELLRNDKLITYTKTVSPTLMQTVQKAIEARSHKVVAAWLVPSKDDMSFTLKLKFNPTANDQKAVIKAITILGPNETLLQPPGQDQRDLIKKGEQVPIEGISVSFQRRDVRDTVTVTYNTTQGTGELRVVGTDPNEAFDRLNRKIESLEGRLAAAEGQVSTLKAAEEANRKAIGDLKGLVDGLQRDVSANVLRKDTAYDLSPADDGRWALDFWRDGIKKENVIRLWERNGTNGQRFMIRVQPKEK